MAGEAPSWADQWGAGGIGAMDEDDKKRTNKENSNKKKMAGFGKAKEAAMAGAQKVKIGTIMGIKWIKNQCQKKKSPTNK